MSAKCYDFGDDGEETKIDFARMIKIVRAAGYTGYVGIESEGQNKLADPQTLWLSTAGNKLSTPKARLSTIHGPRKWNFLITAGNKSSLGRDPVQTALDSEDCLLDGQHVLAELAVFVDLPVDLASAMDNRCMVAAAQ